MRSLVVISTFLVAVALGCGGGGIRYPDGKCAKGNCNNGDCALVWGKQGTTPEYYVGQCKENLPWGKGLGNHRGPGTALYVGEYERGLEHGKGVKYYDNGGVYAGEFKDGDKHGQGTQWFSSGGAYQGEHKNHKRHGKGIVWDPDGTAYEVTMDKSKETRGRSLGKRPMPIKPKRPPDPLKQ